MSEHELTNAARDVIAERRRQVEREGWTPEHDDEHTWHELASAAVCYIHSANLEGVPMRMSFFLDWWPWEKDAFKPKDRRADLVRAGALILAEIERLDRKEQRESAEGAR